MTLLIPNDELVAKAWLVAAVPLAASKVATTLPDPPWTDDEFVQIMQVGGSPDQDVPVGEPVISVNCFAMKASSLKPPWGQANQLAQQIWLATFPVRWAPDPAVELATLPAGYGRAIVRVVRAMSQPKRIESDPSQYAVYNLDLQFSWVPASVVIP